MKPNVQLALAYAVGWGIGFGMKSLMNASASLHFKGVGERRQALLRELVKNAERENRPIAPRFDPWVALATERPEILGRLADREFEDLLWRTAAGALGHPPAVGRAMKDAGYEPTHPLLRQILVDYHDRLLRS